LKLLAYKLQNPAEKVPLALVLLGDQGCGKSLWAKIVREAVTPYGAAVPSHALLSEFNGWVESALICVIDEAQGAHVSKGYDALKSYISETRTMLNEKHRVARQVDSYTFYILTSNDRRVGAYSNDDRRMYVVSAPEAREKAFYDRIGSWLRRGGASHALHWLLNYDLQGWKPPQSAPMTAEKYMAYMENLTPIQRIAEEMKTADRSIITLWIESALAWARSVEASGNVAMARQAQEVTNSMSMIQVRPFYSPEELAMMFPSLADNLHGSRTMRGTPAGEISRQLRESGVRYLKNADDPRGFRYRGMLRQYLVVADVDEFRTPITQNEFDRLMGQFPRYRDLKN
jgi:hypothetical protein